jgi:hypothetical protein
MKFFKGRPVLLVCFLFALALLVPMIVIVGQVLYALAHL